MKKYRGGIGTPFLPGANTHSPPSPGDASGSGETAVAGLLSLVWGHLYGHLANTHGTIRAWRKTQELTMVNVINFPNRSARAKLLEGPKVYTMPHLAKNKSKLIREARALAKQKGHILGEFSLSRIVTGYPPVTYRAALSATCEKCGAQVGIDPEHGAIFGEAFADDCKRN